MIAKEQAKSEIKSLISRWRQQETKRNLKNEDLHFSDFISWLRENSPSHLNFRTATSVEYDVEMWFDQELRQTWRN